MERTPIDRLLPLILAALLLSGAWLLARQAFNLRAKGSEAVADALARSQELLQVKLDAMFSKWQEHLVEEAEASRRGHDEDWLLDRWAGALRNHWEFLSIRLADERGNELALHRDDTILVVVRTSLTDSAGYPVATRFGAENDSLRWAWTKLGHYDPRERIWFSKALENDRESPIWTLRQFGDTAEKVMQASLLISRGHESEAFRVMLLEVSLERAAGAGQSATRSQGVALLTSAGASIKASSSGPRANEALQAAIAQRRANPAERISRHGRFAASFEPYLLNGLNLTACALIDAEPLATASDQQWWTLRLATGWLLLLGAALLALWLRGRTRRKGSNRLLLQNKQLEHRLAKALGERDVLSREVHHRVKNNLQVVSSLLNLQASSLNDGAVREEFLRGKRRIDTIALVHHRLYDHPDLRDIDLQGFLTQLTTSIAAMHGERRSTVSIGVDTHGLRCDQDTAIELGIITCELVNNAYQHAFPHATGGHITVSVTRVEGDLHRLVVGNNGVSADRSSLSGPGKLGLEIVEALAEQLDGSLHVRTEGPPAFEVLLRMKRPASAEAIDA